ncbi:MAG TPA: NAD(P)/FAD-dependent oxidoreductase [Nitrososphaera sp.]|nr:NAD(P)/FAD-dependent oxidoreductase [Nitrososphaera sp.]
MSDYDVIVAGGSISGLLAAREAAAGGLSVAVLEEDSEIGTPEHCGGLVSWSGIQKLGVVPDSNAVQNTKIARARIRSPNNGFEISAEKQNVIVLDRRAFDKQIAFQAQKLGAEIKVRCAMRSFSKDDRGHCVVKTSEGDLHCRYLIDARGVASLITRDREGVLQSAQYEVHAPWIERDAIEVVFDSKRYPGFFAWVIPTGEGSGKVGVAGRGINAASALQSYIDSKGKCSIVRKVYAPIWVNGPVKHFVLPDRTTIVVGDAAGQSKPTTAGGIYTCGIGGVFAGQALAEAEKKSDNSLLEDYQRNWTAMFGAEFEKMLLARRLLERLDNKAIDDLFSEVTQEKIQELSQSGDFDFHSGALSTILGAKNAARVAKTFLGNEIRRLTGHS